ncbi:MAG: hypothetical protein ABI384_01470, partial [Allobranchiibius sp.]
SPWVRRYWKSRPDHCNEGLTLSTGRSNTFRIYLHLDTSGHGWITNSGALPPHLLRQWTCNGLVNPVWETSGSPVNVGRAQRIVPARTRRLIEDRDGGPTDTTNEPDPQTTPYRGASGEALHPAWVRFAPNPTPATTRDRRKLWILAGGTGDPPDPPDRTRSPDPPTAAAED